VGGQYQVGKQLGFTGEFGALSAWLFPVPEEREMRKQLVPYSTEEW